MLLPSPLAQAQKSDIDRNAVRACSSSQPMTWSGWRFAPKSRL